MLEIVKTVASVAGAVLSVSAALALFFKPLRRWLENAVKQSCGVEAINASVASMTTNMGELKDDIHGIANKTDTMLDMMRTQHKASCDLLRSAMMRIYYRYLPSKAIPSNEMQQFKKLAEDYVALGGNSFMTDIVIPAVESWDVTTDADYLANLD